MVVAVTTSITGVSDTGEAIDTTGVSETAAVLPLHSKRAFRAANEDTRDTRISALTAAMVVLLLSASSCLALDSSLESSLAKFRDKYPLKHPNEKLIDDWGVIPTTVSGVDDKAALASDLRGVKNFRYVLNGILYRGGKISPADNARIPPGKKPDNRHPMSEAGLQNLCQQGFGEAIYLYKDDGRVKTPDRVSCTTRDSKEKNELVYKDLPPLFSNPKTANIARSNIRAILTDVREAFLDNKHKPIYVHCWNGWHASGFISAVALRQFCGYSPEEAIAYWDINTDGVCLGKGPGKLGDHVGGYDSVRKQIEAFVPFKDKDFEISDDIRTSVCPTAKYQLDNALHKLPWIDESSTGTVFKVNQRLYCTRS